MKADTAFPYKLYLVISEADCRGRNLLWVAEEAIRGGVDLIQLREKEIDDETFLAGSEQLKVITDRHNVPLIINDNLAVAMRVGAFGIHVGRQDTRPREIRSTWPGCRLLGYSIERPDQLHNQETETADYLGISPVFNTATKTDTITEWGLEGIRQIRSMTRKPLIAIGRMNRENVAEAVRAGADCIAVVSAICAANDPCEAAAELKQLILNA